MKVKRTDFVIDCAGASCSKECKVSLSYEESNLPEVTISGLLLKKIHDIDFNLVGEKVFCDECFKQYVISQVEQETEFLKFAATDTGKYKH